MKVFAIIFFALVAAVAAYEDTMLGASYGGASYGAAAPAAPAAAAASYGGAAAAGGSYGGSSYNIPAPPCPKNYLFGCHPVLKPVPCSAPAAGYGAPIAGGYGSTGAYSHYVPTIAAY